MTSRQLTILCTIILLAALLSSAGDVLVVWWLMHDRGEPRIGAGDPSAPFASAPERSFFGNGEQRPASEEGPASSAWPSPRVLPEPENVSPIQPAAPLDEATVRLLIEQELPEATDQERDVWFQQLRDLQPGEIRSILGMWRRFGPLQGSQIGDRKAGTGDRPSDP